MRKIVLLFTLVLSFTFTTSLFAEVVAPSEESLQEDLSFSLDGTESEREREVASEDKSEDKKLEESPMQYWNFSDSK